MSVLAAPALDTPSVLVVLPAPVSAGAPPPETMIAGLPLLRRIVLAAERAGFDRVLVHPRACTGPGLLAGTGAALLGADPVTRAPGRLVLLPVNVLPQARWLRLLREMPLEPGTPAVDPSGTATVEGVEGGALLRSAENGGPALVEELARRRPRP